MTAESLSPTPTVGHLTWRILRVEVRDELLAIVREPAALLFSVLMPVAFFALFVGIFGGEGDVPGEVGTTMLATFGTFGVLSVTLMNPGISLAADRESGWLRIKRASAVPLPITLAAKIAATLPYAAGVLAAMIVTAAAMDHVTVAAGQLPGLVATLLVGSMALVPIGLAVGSLASSSAAAAILNALLLPMAVACGLWMPLEVLPDVVGSIAPALPAYHLAELGQAALFGGAWAGHALFLACTLLVGAALAGVAYRRARP